MPAQREGARIDHIALRLRGLEDRVVDHAHELAHSLVARRFKMSVSSITLFLLGGVANLTKEPPSAKAEFFMAIAGPATSVAIGVVGLALTALIGGAIASVPNIEAVGAITRYLGEINLVCRLLLERNRQ